MSRHPSGSPEPALGGAPAVDRSVLGEWLGGDEVAINSMLVIFRDSAVTEQTKMRDTLIEDDLTGFSKAAHRLRGAALSMGAGSLAEAAGRLEAAGQAGNETACENGMPELDTQMNRMLAEVPETPAGKTPRINPSAP